ncbi:MAG TPA: hypothetical protein PKA00_19595 [Saprospiraceae bacterium]|nr:hypothetical protein [Saprospiraceae bacterium]HMQ85124.1 hypothetical protein [Saprospiraceae bacterium]
MKNVFFLAALISAPGLPAQSARFVSSDYSDYYEWFHERSQVADLYSDYSKLYTFQSNTKVYAGPCKTSDVLTALPIAYSVTNISYNDDYYLPEDQINGYGDIWYHVKGKDTEGNTFDGYIWGAHLAKGWRETDLNQDGQKEWLMLGISPITRTEPSDINAFIRLVQHGKVLHEQIVPGLCIFEDCDSSPLLRIVQSKEGFTIVEASTMTIGCWAGVEKAYFYWNGQGLERVHYEEYLTGTVFMSQPFNVTSTAQVCTYSHEDKNYNPVWTCQTLRTKEGARAAIGQESSEVFGR